MSARPQPGQQRPGYLYRHVLRNAMGPVVSFLAMTVADIVAGSVVIEQVFALPGLGAHAADVHFQSGLSRWWRRLW